MNWHKLAVFFMALVYLMAGQPVKAETQDAFHSKYNLVQVMVLSRHNIRAPIGKTEELAKVTHHPWHDFCVKSGELTAHGAQLEKEMGQYFRRYFEKEELFSADDPPEAKNIWFYANAFQRTVATAQSFADGMFPDVDVQVKYEGELGTKDPVFWPEQAGHKAAFDVSLSKELAALGGSEGLAQRIKPGLQEAALVLDNPEAGSGEFSVHVKGGLHFGSSLSPYWKACDALILQYYELGDSRASFGHDLNFNAWKDIAFVKDLGIHTYRHVPTLARAVARPVLSIFQEELNLQQRKFTFLCGHDTNIVSVLGAVEAKETDLPEAIEQEAPIGCKLVVEEWQDKDGESFVALKLVYPSISQLCGQTPIDANHPPQAVPLHLQNIYPNRDGLITMQDFQQRLTDAITSDAELLGQHY
ncbi:MAG: histidine-type phosphatase [Selenomonas sp.]|uniref:histidine-type phosphatase n=1 Tax=Selenomonas sp. TaxID=2053611 RepID=UPI0025E5AA63|nr:histidine-type phosphatase [Selenomonas sp.]MCR5756757.1 histidine-type phosphatase [Selenomonas sp.]